MITISTILLLVDLISRDIVESAIEMLVVSTNKGAEVDMGRIRADCKSCGKQDVHFAVRLHIREQDRYSTAANSIRRFVILVCQECAAEHTAVKDIEKWAIDRYDDSASVSSAYNSTPSSKIDPVGQA